MNHSFVFKWSALFLVFVGSAGCATTTYAVGVDGYRARANVNLADANIAVLPNELASNPLLAAEVKDKIEFLLLRQGYRVTSLDEADVILVNLFGMGSPREQSGGVFVPLSNMVAYVPTTSVQHFRWMMLAAAPSDVISEPNLQAADVPWIWIAEVSSSGRSDDLRDVLDYMLVVAFEHFGETTGTRRVTRINDRDQRIAILRARRH